MNPEDENLLQTQRSKHLTISLYYTLLIQKKNKEGKLLTFSF